MAREDFYEMLGVGREADAGDIKRAYRKLAMQYHPDRNPGDSAAENRFKELSEAYEILSDEQKRAAYDHYGHAAFENGGAGPAHGFDFNFTSSFADVFDDLFGEFRGGRRRGGGARRGADLRYDLEINLEEAFRGKHASITIPTTVACGTCEGSGAAPGSQPSTCNTCRGIGKVRVQSGFFTIERACPACHGAGQVIGDPCDGCRGGGQVQKDKTVDFDIPAGVDDGTRIRLSGEGEAGGRGGPAGDLYVFLSVAPHRLFKREGGHLYCQVPISMVSAAMGGGIEVPTLEGNRISVTVPAGTQSGRQFRLRGKGMPQVQGHGRGDMYVQTMVETPVNLTKRQKDLLREFEDAGQAETTSPESAGFFAKVKDLLEGLAD